MTKKLSTFEKDQRRMRRQSMSMIKNLIKDQRNPLNFVIEREQIGRDYTGKLIYSKDCILTLRYTDRRRIRNTKQTIGLGDKNED